MKKIVEALLTISIVLLMLLIITSTVSETIPLLLSFIVAVLYIVATVLFDRKGMFTIIGIYVIGVVFNWKTFLVDTYDVLQQLAITVANERFIFLQPFEQASTYDGGLFASLLALFIAISALKAVQQRSLGSFMLLVVCTIIIQIVLKTSAPVVVTVSFFIVAFMTTVYMKNASFYKKFLPISLVIAMLFTITVAGLQVGNVTGAVMQQAVQTQLDSWRFNGDVSRLPNGQLQHAIKQSTDEHIALNVVMEKPEPMYLRGFLGTQLEGSTWQRVAGAHYLQHEPLFQALQREGFTSYNQLALAAAPLQQAEAYKMSIQNVDADRCFGYVPYEAQTINEAFQFYEGAAITSAHWRGTSSYELVYSPTTVQQYPKIANSLYAQSGSSYLNMESYYNEFVYDSYLQIADDDRAVLANHLQIDEQNMTYEKAIEHVHSFLAQNLQYNETASSVTSVQQLLEESKEGYAPHYATLATLLFRSLQVPARYVEGYIVTKQDVEQKEEFNEIQIAAKNAHAWTEIYVDTVGWIPVEVTPGYDEKMPAVSTEDYPAFNGTASAIQSEQVAGATQTQQVKDEKIEDEKTTPEVTVNKHTYWWIIALLLILIAVSFIYKKIKRSRYLRAGNANVQAIRHWALLLYMLERETDAAARADMTVHDGSLQQAQRIYEKAKYSGQPISEQELATVMQAFKATKKVLQQNKKHMYKLQMLWRY